MDPQQRQLLEMGYIALHSAGMPRSELMGSGTAVHVGLVLLTGMRENLNGMYAGVEDATSWLGFAVFAASTLVMVAAWVLLRPPAQTSIAERVAEVHVKAPNGVAISDEMAKHIAESFEDPAMGWRTWQWLARDLVPDPTVVL